MITRHSIRDQVHDELLRMLNDGELAVGANVNERALADHLGVSRTPIREALLRLGEGGLVEHRQGRGFFVTAVTVRDAHEVYPMISALECLALRSTDPTKLRAGSRSLDEIAAQMLAARADAHAAQAADERWHSTLVAMADNKRLAGTLGELKRLVNRYEYAYLSEPEAVAVSVAQHRAISAALLAGDIDAAAEALEQNWRHGMDRLFGQLRRHTRRQRALPEQELARYPPPGEGGSYRS